MGAKFIARHYDRSFERCLVYLEYEYRGMRYEVMEDMRKGNEPLAWQHKTEQARIDKILDARHVDAEPVDLDEIYNMLGWN